MLSCFVFLEVNCTLLVIKNFSAGWDHRSPPSATFKTPSGRKKGERDGPCVHADRQKTAW